MEDNRPSQRKLIYKTRTIAQKYNINAVWSSWISWFAKIKWWTRVCIKPRLSNCQLRVFLFGHSCLRAHLFRVGFADSAICACGRADEDNDRFFLHRDLFDRQRYVLHYALEPLFADKILSAYVLLGGPEFKGSDKRYEIVARAVTNFVNRQSVSTSETHVKLSVVMFNVTFE